MRRDFERNVFGIWVVAPVAYKTGIAFCEALKEAYVKCKTSEDAKKMVAANFSEYARFGHSPEDQTILAEMIQQLTMEYYNEA